MKTTTGLIAALALAALAAGSCAEARAPFKYQPRPGTVSYTYTMAEFTNGQAASGYRVDFDLVSGPHNSLIAVFKSAEQGQGDSWQAAKIDPACARALHAGKGELARVTLSPISPDAVHFGDGFISHCAPDAIFFPLTDILNVALVQMQPKFGLSKLSAPGDIAAYDGFSTSLTRASEDITAASPGGETRFFARSPKQVTIDWVPKPMALTLVEHTAANGNVTLTGTERFAFRLEINPKSGELDQASTLYDSLAMVVSMPGLPPENAPHVAVRRTVLITRR